MQSLQSKMVRLPSTRPKSLGSCEGCVRNELRSMPSRLAKMLLWKRMTSKVWLKLPAYSDYISATASAQHGFYALTTPQQSVRGDASACRLIQPRLIRLSNTSRPHAGKPPACSP